MELTQREREIIYFALSRTLEDSELDHKEWGEIDDLRDKFVEVGEF